jgi:hypothetical protein
VKPTRVISLASLLAEIAAEPERLTRERFVALYESPDFEPLGQAAFDKHFAGEAGDHIDPAIVQADLDELAQTAESVKRYVDRYIAHSDREGLETLPTFGDIDEAIDAIGGLFRKIRLAPNRKVLCDSRARSAGRLARRFPASVDSTRVNNEGLTIVGTSVRDRAGLGLPSLPPCPRSWQRHRGSFVGL